MPLLQDFLVVFQLPGDIYVTCITLLYTKICFPSDSTAFQHVLMLAPLS